MLATASPITEKRDTTKKTINVERRPVFKKFKDIKVKIKGVATIALKKPSMVLLGLTLLMKDLFPNFFPAKKAIVSINMLTKATKRTINLSFVKLIPNA